MRAMVVTNPGGPEAFEARIVPDPTPSERDCVVRVVACVVCSHDVATRNGTLRRGIVMPVICGHEIAGEVVGIGNAVRNRRVGDRVLTMQRRRVCGACAACRAGRETLCRNAEFLGDVGLNGGYAEFVLVATGPVLLFERADVGVLGLRLRRRAACKSGLAEQGHYED